MTEVIDLRKTSSATQETRDEVIVAIRRIFKNDTHGRWRYAMSIIGLGQITDCDVQNLRQLKEVLIRARRFARGGSARLIVTRSSKRD